MPVLKNIWSAGKESQDQQPDLASGSGKVHGQGQTTGWEAGKGSLKSSVIHVISIPASLPGEVAYWNDEFLLRETVHGRICLQMKGWLKPENHSNHVA